MADEFFTINADGSWKFHGEDSRLRDHTRNQVTYRVWNPFKQQFVWETMDQCYCKNCGVEWGYSSRHSAYVVVFCDKCWEKGQDPARFIPMTPDQEWKWRNGLSEEE